MGGEIEQFLAFLLVDLGDPRVGVAHVHAGDAADQIDVLPPFFVVEVFLVAFDSQKGLFVVVCIDRRDVVLEASDFLVRLAGVGPWFVRGERCSSDDQIGNPH